MVSVIRSHSCSTLNVISAFSQRVLGFANARFPADPFDPSTVRESLPERLLQHQDERPSLHRRLRSLHAVAAYGPIRGAWIHR